MPNVVAEKHQLRIEARRIRDAIDPVTRAAAAKRLVMLADQVLAEAPTSAAAPVVSAYIAIGSELDPAPLLGALVGRVATIALPVMAAKNAPLKFRAWQVGDGLVERMWGIREPAGTATEVEPDILLVPLLLVDRAGRRLGYGGGFYDRTLAKLQSFKPIFAAGLAFPEQCVDAVPHERYDRAVDAVLTPYGLDHVHQSAGSD